MPVFFLVNLLSAFNLYYANLHSHTRYSDGRGTPRHAFAYARDTARIHILAITDHGEMLDSLEWEDTKQQAEQATIPMVFLGLVGFEWTSWTQGHLNVFDTPGYTNRESTPTIDSLYRWMTRQPDAIGQFNHPWPTAFNSFSYIPYADSLMAFYEMQTREQANWYHIALDSGWRVAIAANQDNHFADWGMGNQLTGIWADSLTKGSIIRAIKARRTFGTLDRNFQLWFKINGHWMGSTIPDSDINFDIFAFDPDIQDFIKRIDIITNGNRIVDSLSLGNTNCAIYKAKLSATPHLKDRYYFVRVIENDSDYIISSPIWVKSSTITTDSVINLETNSFLIYPNPWTSYVKFLFRPNYALGTLRIYSASGKKIKTISLSNQTVPICWNGKDDFGNEVPTGVYLVCLGSKTKKIIRRARNSGRF